MTDLIRKPIPDAITDILHKVATKNTNIPADTPSEGSRSNEPCSTNAYLAKPISFFQSATNSKVPNGMQTIRSFLDTCRNGIYREDINVIRAEPDKKKRDALKIQLYLTRLGIGRFQTTGI